MIFFALFVFQGVLVWDSWTFRNWRFWARSKCQNGKYRSWTVGPSLSLFYEFLKIQKITSSLNSEPSFLTHNCSCRASELRAPKFSSGDPTTNNARLYRRYRLNFNPIPCPTYRTQVRRTLLFDLSIVRRWTQIGRSFQTVSKYTDEEWGKVRNCGESAIHEHFKIIFLSSSGSSIEW